MRRYFLLLPHLKIQNANAMSSPYTIGFPAITAWLGAIHALQRQLHNHGYADIILDKLAISCHSLNVQRRYIKGNSTALITVSRNPLIKKGKEDGYVRSGNVSYPKDMNSGAANLPYAKFLLLTDNDGQILVEAFNANDSSVREWCKEAGQDFSTLQHSINKVLKNRKMSSTDARVKQVYFPLDRAGSEYHLLSILAPAGMIFALKDRIVNIRKNENEDLPNLTRIKYSAKPQNISYLSSKYGGSAYLLPSFPPESKKHAISLPYISSNFFRQCFNNKEIQAYLKQMHKLIIEKRNNLYVRNKLKSILHIIIDQILWQAEQIRLYEYQDWEQKYYEKLDISLRILLDNRIDPSKRDDEWQNEISEEIARAIIKAYREQEEAEMLGDEDMR
ncbi:MAG: hypothetical protein O7C58_04910, partial [Rickettsia endosymbiont of Ixodes persulcatus]|nr:hypothetical protein [Rickettsia endosymbiont of Ixodes persulcatus]